MDHVPFIGYYFNKPNYYSTIWLNKYDDGSGIKNVLGITTSHDQQYILALLGSNEQQTSDFYILNLIEAISGGTVRGLKLDAEHEGYPLRDVLTLSYYYQKFVMMYNKGGNNYLLFIDEDLKSISKVISIDHGSGAKLLLRCLSGPLEDSFVYVGGYHYNNALQGIFYGRFDIQTSGNNEQRFFQYTKDSSNGADQLGIYNIDHTSNYMLACVSNENSQSASYPVMGYLLKNYQTNYEGTTQNIGNAGSKFICIYTSSKHSAIYFSEITIIIDQDLLLPHLPTTYLNTKV
eukprot:403345682